jgi:hypothetical protein
MTAMTGFPRNRPNTRHRAKAISAAISRNHIWWQYKRSERLLRDAILGRSMFLNRLHFHDRHWGEMKLQLKLY